MSLFNSVISGDHQVKSMVFGYIREHESSKSINIPSVISYICLKYHFINEFFDKALNNYFEISNDKKMITNIGGTIDHTIYCHQWIPTSSNIMVQWTFFIKKMQNGMYVGLASNDKNINKDFCINAAQAPCYQLQNTGDRYYKSNGDDISWMDAKPPYYICEEPDHFYPLIGTNLRWKSGDTITFILDLNDQNDVFCIEINNQPRQVIFNKITKGIDIKYKMALQMPVKDDCVILKSFQESYS